MSDARAWGRSTLGHLLRHGRQTLKRNSITSPSLDDVVLALDADLAELLGLRPRADVEQFVPVDHLGRMKPRWKSVWMRPAHSRRGGAVVERPRPGLLLAGREERPQPEQVVGAAHHAEQRALAEAEALEHLGPLDGVDDRRRLGLELHAHADDLDVVAGRSCRTRRRPAASTAGIESRSSSPTFTTTSTRRLVSRKYGASSSRSLGASSPAR